MNQAITVLVWIIFLAESVHADCDSSGTIVDTQCNIEDVKISHEIFRGDQLRIIVNFRNGGTETCCYRANLYQVGNLAPIEKSPNDFWLRLKSGESGTIKLSSGLSGWNACTLNVAPTDGKAEIGIIGAVPSDTLPGFLQCELGWNDNPATLDVCFFNKVDYLFDTPPNCCGTYEGVTCMDYGDSYGGFTCDESENTQINLGVSCLVECKYDESAKECSCALVEACAIKCDAGPPASCVYDDFTCMGLHYKCSNGVEPEVKCSNTANCKYQCASKCGREATCSSDCENCCNSPQWCNKVSLYAYGDEEKEACMRNCMSICRTNEELCNVLYIIQGVAAGVAILLIMLHGMKWMLSDDMEGRQNAKRGIAYVFVGLILIITAAELASYFFMESVVC